jgi:hypothetical protein
MSEKSMPVSKKKLEANGPNAILDSCGMKCVLTANSTALSTYYSNYKRGEWKKTAKMTKQNHHVSEQQQLNDFAYPNLNQLKPILWPFSAHFGYFSYQNTNNGWPTIYGGIVPTVQYHPTGPP